MSVGQSAEIDPEVDLSQPFSVPKNTVPVTRIRTKIRIDSESHPLLECAHHPDYNPDSPTKNQYREEQLLSILEVGTIWIVVWVMSTL